MMEMVAPLGPVYQAGTLSGNPVAMAAGIATLKQLRTSLYLYERIEARALQMQQALLEASAETSIPVQVNRVGSLLTPFFTTCAQVQTFAEVMTCDRERYAAFFRAMLDRGMYMAPSQFEAMFLSSAHSEADMIKACESVKASFVELKGS